MAANKVIQDLDKKVLECPICMKRLTQPRTLPCLHTYCLECLENWAVVKCKLQCPLCSRTFQIPEGGVQKLSPNTTINNLLEYVKTMEEEKQEVDDELVEKEEKPPVLLCACRKSPPTQYCKECNENVCIDCKKNHKSSRLKSKKHSLVPLSELVIGSTKTVTTHKTCSVHNNAFEYFCKPCMTLACSRCKDQIHKPTSEHLVVPVSTICIELKKEFGDLLKIAKNIKEETQSRIQSFETNVDKQRENQDECKRNIDEWMEEVMNQVMTYCQTLKNSVDAIGELQTYSFNSKIQKSQALLTNISGLISSLDIKCKNEFMLDSLESNLNEIREIRSRLSNVEIDHSEVYPSLQFLPSQEFTTALNNGIGMINNMEDLYKVSDKDTSVEIAEGESFTIRIDCFKGNKKCELIAKLSDPLGQETVPTILQDNGKYKVTGKCNITGEWLLSISTGNTFIRGSPVNIKVQKVGLSLTIPNILDYMEHTKDTRVMSVLVDKDGSLLVTSASRDILRFKKTGEYIDKVVMSPATRVSRLCIINDNLMVYSDLGNKCVTTCDHDFKELLSFGKGVFKHPRGLAVRRDVNDIYVADADLHRIFRFDYNTGKLIGTIGSEGKGIGQVLRPQDVAITRDGYILVVDFGNHRITMLNAMEKFVKIMVGIGKQDGKVIGPSSIVVCDNDNFIISSNHKLQLFDRSGTFIKRIDSEKDGLDVPVYMTLLSARTVAVANHRQDNVKIFTY